MDFEKVDLNQIQAHSFHPERWILCVRKRGEYFSLMEMVRGLRARMRFTNGRMVTKAGIIRLLKSEPYSLSDWMARQVYNDSINFFYTQDNIRPEAFAALYAERAEKWADAAFLAGKIKEARALLKLAR